MKITKENVERLQQEKQENDKLALLRENETRNKNVFWPAYWAKRKNRLAKGFVKMLYETAKKDYDTIDDYGVYKPGTFLHGACIVEVARDNGIWSVHIISEHPITLSIVTDIRDKYLPDNLMMAMIFGTRAERRKMKGVLLYEIPREKAE